MTGPARRREGRVERLVAARPRAVVISFALVALLCGLLATRLRIHPGIDAMLLADDPELLRNHEIKRDFRNDELLVLGLDLGRPFTLEDLRLVDRLSRQLEALDTVDRVLSLTTVFDLVDERGALTSRPLVSPADLDPALEPAQADLRLARLHARVLGHPLFDRNVVSHDLRTVAIVVTPKLVDGRPSGAVNQRLVTAVEALIAGVSAPTYLGGYPAAEADSSRIALRDFVRLSAVSFVLVLLVSLLLLRHPAAPVVILAIAVFAELVTLAWLAVTHGELTVITATLPAILLAVSSAYGIYLFDHQRELAGTTGEQPTNVSRAFWVSAITTATGFASLMLAPVKALRDLGAGLAIGISAALVATLLLGPALLVLLRPRVKPPRIGVGAVQWGVDLARRPALVLAGTVLVVLAAALGIRRVVIESNPITYWREDSFHRVSDRYLNQHLDGTLFVNVVLSTGAPEGALDPGVLRFAQALIDHARASGSVTNVVSLLDFLALIDDALAPERLGTRPADRAFLASPNLAAQYMVLYESSGDTRDSAYYVDFDRSALNLYLKVKTRSSTEILALRKRLETFAAQAASGRPTELAVEVLGTWMLFPKAMDEIARSMVRGLTLSGVVILIVMSVFVRSVWLGFLAVVPNVLPIVICLGLMGFTGVPISFATSITGCLALGLAVDDTAHVLSRLSPGTSIRSVYRACGRSLVDTCLALGVGFLALGASEFEPVSYLGLVTTITLLVAVLCDLLVLPSLLRLAGYPLETRAETAASSSTP